MASALDRDPYGPHEMRRGVYRDVAPFPGVAEYRVIDSQGALLMLVQVKESLADDRFERRLHRWLRSQEAVFRVRLVE